MSEKPQRILVAMYCKDGYSRHRSDSAHERIKDLRQRATSAFAMLAGREGPPPADALKIMLVSEFYFRKDRRRTERQGKGTAYSQESFDLVCLELRTLSATMPNFLVVGGSILWTPNDGMQTRSTVPIYHNGQELMLYEKRVDASELSIAERNLGFTWQPGKLKGSFNLGELRCGIETSTDHEMGELRKLSHSFDLQIIVSNTVGLKNPATRVGGFVLHCNAAQSDRVNTNSLYQHPFNVNDKVTGLTSGLVTLFDVTLT